MRTYDTTERNIITLAYERGLLSGQQFRSFRGQWRSDNSNLVDSLNWCNRNFPVILDRERNSHYCELN